MFYLTTHLRLYDIRHMAKDHSDSERGDPLLPHGLLFPINRSVVRAFGHGAMGRRIDPSWWTH